MDLVWQITEDLPDSPNFRPAKLSCYMLNIIEPDLEVHSYGISGI